MLTLRRYTNLSHIDVYTPSNPIYELPEEKDQT